MSFQSTADVDAILKEKYPAKAHCRRVAKYIADQQQSKQNSSTTTTEAETSKDGLIYLEAQKTHMVEDDDQAMAFRQRRYFFYLSGCKLPDAFLTYDIAADYLTLFIPPIDPDSVMWAGLPESKEEALSKYDVDEVRHTNEVNDSLATYAKTQHLPHGTTVYTIPEQLTPSISFTPFTTTNTTQLRHAIDESRVIKDRHEIALIRRANQISTIAHLAAQAACATATNEQELYGAFIGTCIAHGAHEQAYHSICASGTSCSTLHYIRNDQPLQSRLNILLDAGAEYNCYCADITRTFPINGQFTAESQVIYDIVREMQDAAFGVIRAGIQWEEVHSLTHRVAIRGLLRAGIFRSSFTEEEIFASRVSVAFYPHGLGHYLGMDTHDTGGHADYHDEDGMYKYLRVRGSVPAGAVITVEPGVYFCRFLLDPILEDPSLSRFVDREVLDRYWDVGGVRIEDDVLVLDGGFENLTDTPKL